jgi:hypothetical protein
MTEETTVMEVADIGGQADVEAAFVNSENHSFDGIKLHGYGPSRICAAQAMGLHYGTVDAAGQERFTDGKVYPGAMRDTAVVLWLCSLSDRDDAIEAASRAPKSASLKAIEWGGDHGIMDLGGPKFWEGFMMFLDIMKEIQDARVVPEKKSGPESLVAVATGQTI